MILSTPREKEFVSGHIDDDVRALALRMKEGTADFRPRFVLQQIAGIQIMRRKMPLWADNQDIIYPIHLSLEQCSSAFTANYKREIIERYCPKMSECNFADLTGGFGVDFSVMSVGFGRAHYVERNSELCEIAANNFQALNLDNYEIINGDGVEFLKNFDGHFGAFFIDPARRDSSGGKTVHIQDCEPNILDFQDVILQKADIAIIKLSPMLDISECQLRLKNIAEIHAVASDGECKEILVVLTADPKNDEPRIIAVNNNLTFSFLKSEEQNCAATIAANVQEGMYLYEPNAAIMKAAPFRLLTQRFGAKKIARNSNLYVSDEWIEDFPGRGFRIVKVGGIKDFKSIEKANIAIRNFPLKADELRKQLKIKDGGDIYLFATTLNDGRKVIIETRKIIITFAQNF